MFNFNNLKKFETGFWYMCIDCLFTYGISFTSVVLGSQEYMVKYGFGEDDTG